MKKNTLLFCAFLALASCNKDNTTTTEDNIGAAAEAATEAEATPAQDAVETETMSDAAIEEAIAEDVNPGTSTSASKAPTADNPLFNFTLQKGQAGAVKIGMSIDELHEQYGVKKLREIELNQEGNIVKAYEVLGERNRPDLRVEQQCQGSNCKVWRVTVLNPAYKTQSGIGIGSMFGDVKSNVKIKSVGQGEGNFVAISEDAKMSFVLDMRGIPAERWNKLKVNDIPNSTLVSGVMLF